MTALAFDFFASAAPSQVHAKRVPAFVSNVPETLTKSLESLSSNDNFESSQDPAGEEVSEVPSSQVMLRELGELISPNQPAKVLYPLLQADLRRHCPSISTRRVRAIYNGEVSRLWSDEALAVRLALSARRNQKARRDFARAAVEMTKQLAAHGVPLTADQRRIVASLSVEASA